MNTATHNLETDHVYILRLMDVMERMVMNLTTDVSHMELVVNLIRNYADGFHHAKEENLLFPMLVQKGFSNEQGPVAVMLHEHVEGRNFVKEISRAIAEYQQGREEALVEVYRNMQGYVELLQSHIGKENNVLFRMADRMLSSKEQEDLLNQFEAVEAKENSNGKIDQFIVDIDGLAIVYKSGIID